MTSDKGVVERLRANGTRDNNPRDGMVFMSICDEAADRIETLERALRPFAEYMKDGHDLDNNGKPLPDSDGVGWVYLTIGDFRLARAALSTSANGAEK